MAASDPSDVQLVAPALLQLNRGDKNLPYEPCPSPACGAPITSFPDCLECRDSPGLSLQCDSCWTDCASPCDDDDCHIPQPCYDEHCAVESCVDSACAADSCTDVTCPETVHCNATCFDTNCMYNFGDDMASFDNQDCGQANCFGFLPPGPGMNAFESNNDLLYPCPQATTPHHMHQMHHMPPPDHFDHFRLTDLEHQHDHIDHNRHKRRRIQPNGIQTNGHLSFDQQSEPWSDDQLDAMFSPQSFNTPIDPSFPGAFDFNCDPDCHHQLKHTDPWASEIASSLPCQPAADVPANKLKRRSGKPARLLPAPTNEQQSPIFPPLHTASLPPADSDLEQVCLWSLGNKVCGHRFSTAKELDDHLQTAHTSKLGPQAFICRWEGCNTTFKHRGKLNRHISGAHSKYHAYVCTHTDPTTSEPCGRTFCTKEQLKNHETTHTGERKYKCRFCDHTSATKTQHNTHERIHTKEKPYQCPWCGHRSGDSSNLSKHVRNKHPGMAGRAKKSVSLEAPPLLAS